MLTEKDKELFTDWLCMNLQNTSKSNVELIIKHVDHYFQSIHSAEELKEQKALWLVAEGEHVLLKVEAKKGKWITLIKERLDSPFSHIIEPFGIENKISQSKP